MEKAGPKNVAEHIGLLDGVFQSAKPLLTQDGCIWMTLLHSRPARIWGGLHIKKGEGTEQMRKICCSINCIDIRLSFWPQFLYFATEPMIVSCKQLAVSCQQLHVDCQDSDE